MVNYRTESQQKIVSQPIVIHGACGMLVHSGQKEGHCRSSPCNTFLGSTGVCFICSFSDNCPQEDLKKIGDLPQESLAFYLVVNHI
jgi:hypothetical protein